MTKHQKKQAPDTSSPTASGVRKAVDRSEANLQAITEQLLLSGLRADETIDDLRTVGEFRERLIAVIGHDLRNPLNAILMATGLLVNGGRLSEKEVKLAERALNSARRMTRMITHVLEFTRARRDGSVELVLADVNLADVAETIAAELRLGAHASVEVRVHGECVGYCDVGLVSQAIQNVASNATDHAEPGSPVVIDLRTEADAIVVAISNRGEPIPDELRPLIFDPFRHGISDDRRSDHLGLGLFVAHQAVVSHGGAIDVESRDGVTTFTLHVPRHPKRSPALA